MTDIKSALRKPRMWFGTYTKAGELKKVQVWCFVHQGRLEFLTPRDSLKVRRLRRNPRVICMLGAENGPSVEGRGEIITDASLWLGYRAYWKTHPLMMLALAWVIRRNIRRGEQVLIRITPDDPALFGGLREPGPLAPS